MLSSWGEPESKPQLLETMDAPQRKLSRNAEKSQIPSVIIIIIIMLIWSYKQQLKMVEHALKALEWVQVASIRPCHVF